MSSLPILVSHGRRLCGSLLLDRKLAGDPIAWIGYIDYRRRDPATAEVHRADPPCPGRRRRRWRAGIRLTAMIARKTCAGHRGCSGVRVATAITLSPAQIPPFSATVLVVWSKEGRLPAQTRKFARLYPAEGHLATPGLARSGAPDLTRRRPECRLHRAPADADPAAARRPLVVVLIPGTGVIDTVRHSL